MAHAQSKGEMHMKERHQDIFNAVAQASRAIRRGDIAAAERWLRIAQRADDVAKRVGSRLRHIEFQRRQAASS